MFPRRRVGLKQVAARAGTSVATASRVLNGTGYASEAVRQRVLQAARELHYEPNLRARGLRQRSSYTIGLIIPDLLNTYYTALADALGQLLAEAGYGLLLASSRDDPQSERALVHAMVGHDVAGLLWVPATTGTELLDYLEAQHVPVVTIVRSIAPERVDTVVFEDFKGSYTATRYLLDLGHRRIGYVGSEMYSSNRARWEGYRAALLDGGLEVDADLVRIGALRDSWGMSATESLLRLPAPPTAIFVASNAVMPGVMRTIQRFEVKVPEEISLICFDDVEWFAFSKPSITAISVSCSTLAQSALELLLRRIEHRDDGTLPPTCKEISFQLIVRESTAPPGAAWLPKASAGDQRWVHTEGFGGAAGSAEMTRAEPTEWHT